MIEYIEPSDVDDLVALLGFVYRDRGLLLSALAGPMPVFGEETYPGIHSKAAVLFLSVNRDHPLLDGNKRLSWLITVAFYELNGYDLEAESPSAVDRFVRSVAGGALTIEGITAWLADRTYPIA